MTAVSAKPATEDLDRPVWGAEAIGAVIGRTPRQAFHMLEAGHLSATKKGRIWVSTPRRLLADITAAETA